MPQRPKPTVDGPRDLLAVMGRGVVPPILQDRKRRKEMGLPTRDDERGPYMVELNILYRGGLREASKAFLALCHEVFGDDFQAKTHPVEISKSYFKAQLSVDEWRRLLTRDDDVARNEPTLRVIY